jgi:hypothetical protein
MMRWSARASTSAGARVPRARAHASSARRRTKPTSPEPDGPAPPRRPAPSMSCCCCDGGCLADDGRRADDLGLLSDGAPGPPPPPAAAAAPRFCGSDAPAEAALALADARLALTGACCCCWRGCCAGALADLARFWGWWRAEGVVFCWRVCSSSAAPPSWWSSSGHSAGGCLESGDGGWGSALRLVRRVCIVFPSRRGHRTRTRTVGGTLSFFTSSRARAR